MLKLTKSNIWWIKYRKRLYNSFDSVLTPREDKKLGSILSSSKELLGEKNKIEKLRIMLACFLTGKFQSNFETNIIQKVYLTKSQIFFHREIISAFKKFAYAAVLVIAFLLLINLEEHGEIKILSKEKMSITETISSEYLYMSELQADLKEGYKVE